MSGNEIKKETVGYRIRWTIRAPETVTKWYASPVSTTKPSKGQLFATKEAALACLATCNDGWQKNAKVVRFVRKFKQ